MYTLYCVGHCYQGYIGTLSVCIAILIHLWMDWLCVDVLNYTLPVNICVCVCETCDLIIPL